jgi:hypothetical protein
MSLYGKISRALILCFVGLVVFVFALYQEIDKSQQSRIDVRLECINTICIEHKEAGLVCTVVGPLVSSITIEEDPVNPRYTNVIITPSNNQCQ